MIKFYIFISFLRVSCKVMFRSEFDRLQDVHSSAWYAFISGTRWFGVWLDWIVVFYLAIVVFSFMVLGGGRGRTTGGK